MPAATSPASKPLDVADPNDVLALILGAAESALGVPYQWGGNSLATGVDCSGLVQRAFAAAGISLPRVSNQQANVGQQIGSIDEAQPGDLLSWDNSSRNNGADHIAIYLGNGLMIEAYRTGAPVRVTQVRAGARINRVVGVVPATNPPANPVLGPNQDRKFTAQALGVGPGVNATMANDPDVVTAAAVSGQPEGGLGDGLPANATPEQTEAYIRERLPQLAPFMGNDEIRYVLTWAVREDVSDSELEGALRRTTYWQEHSDTSRAVDFFLGTASKAEIARITDLAKGRVNDLFRRSGITLDDPTLSRLAMDALRAGHITLQGQVMNPDGLNDMLGFTQGASEVGGETAFNAGQLMQIARSEYLLPLTQREVDDWAIRMLQGEASEESFRAEMQQRAEERYPTMALNGRRPISYTQGIAAEIGRLLEVDPDTIDFLDPQWNRFIEFHDGEQMRMPTLGEAAQMARDMALDRPFAQRPMWAKEADADIALNMARWAGRLA